MEGSGARIKIDNAAQEALDWVDKKQLAERYAQIRIDKNMGHNKSTHTTSSKRASKKGNRESEKVLDGNNQMADPEVLKAILNRKDPGL